MAIIKVLKSFFASFSIIYRGNFKKYFLLPILLNVLSFIIFIYFGRTLLLHILEGIKSDSIIIGVLGYLVLTVATGVYFSICEYFILTLLSPFLSLLSEKVEFYLTGKSYSYKVRDNVRFIYRGLKISIRAFVKQLGILCITLIVGLLLPIPIQMFIPIIFFVIQCYYTGLFFMDYTLERYKSDVNETFDFVENRKSYVVFIGLLFSLLSSIPILGIIIAPILSCVTATKITLDILEE